MFIHRLPLDNNILGFEYTLYAKKHFLNNFKKDYPGKQWALTEESIKNDLSRLKIETNTTQFSSQIDELCYRDNKWIAKYDFAIAGSQTSPKSSGNRCVIYIDNDKQQIKVLLMYGKTDLPKNKGETAYIKDTIKIEFSEIYDFFEQNSEKYNEKK